MAEICECGAMLEPHPFDPATPTQPPKGFWRQPLRGFRLAKAWNVAHEVYMSDPDAEISPLLYCPVCHMTRIHFRPPTPAGP